MNFLEFFGKKIFKKKHISLHLSDLLFEQFSDCHVDYIDFSSYEMKKKMMSVLIQWSFQGPLLRPGKNVMLQKITRKQESCVKGSNDIGNIGVC